MPRYHVRLIRKAQKRADELPDMPVSFIAITAEDLPSAVEQAAAELRRLQQDSSSPSQFYRLEVETAETYGFAQVRSFSRDRSAPPSSS